MNDALTNDQVPPDRSPRRVTRPGLRARRRAATSVVGLAAALSLTACSGRRYDVPLPAPDPGAYASLGERSVTATGVQLFDFIPIMNTDKVERAVRNIILSSGGDAVANVSVRERWYWAYVLTLHKIDVTATVLKRK